MDEPSEHSHLFPMALDVEQGKTYLWCGCGKSLTPPLCDKDPACTKALNYTADLNELVYFCNCKQTKTPPLCDGSHSKLLLEFIKNGNAGGNASVHGTVALMRSFKKGRR